MVKTLSLVFVAAVSVGAYGQAAPIVRQGPGAGRAGVNMSQPIAGVTVDTDANSTVTTVKAGVDGMEIRVERGRADVQVHRPADHSEILVDLPGGQTTLLKDGLYTFNAETDTVRVLKGEAEVYPGAAGSNARAIKVKEEHELSFAAGGLRAVEVDPRQMMADVLPGVGRSSGEGYRGGGDYGEGYFPGYYSYAPYRYGYGWGEPYGWGYPYGFGLGFGYGFGGYYGGYRGGYGRFGRR